MGRVKELLYDYENAKEILNELIEIISSENFISLNDKISINQTWYISFLFSLKNELSNFTNRIDNSIINFICEEISDVLENAKTILKDNSNISIKEFNKSIERAYVINHNRVNTSNVEKEKNKLVNSEKYYIDRIKDLELREQNLSNALNEIKGNSEIENKRLKEELENTIYEKQKSEFELALKKKQDEAKENWESKINETFKELKGYLTPIKHERNRLNQLYNVYATISGALVLLIIIIESYAIKKIGFGGPFPELKNYITLYLPLPVAGLLLWGFIYQMNRAQRQLVVLAKNIHSVEYIQGLLLSINKLSPNVEDGIVRINSALDKIISNHLNLKEVSSEEDIIKEENKDSIPIETVIKILKDLKDIGGKK